MEPARIDKARQALLAAEMTFRTAGSGVFAAAADLVEAVRAATVDFDPMCRPEKDGLRDYAKELRDIAKALRTASSGRGFGKKSKRHVAVERLVRLARDVIKGKVRPNTKEWSAEVHEGLSNEQLAALALEEVFGDRLPEAPRPYLSTPQREKLLAAVAKLLPPRDEFSVFRAVAQAHGFSRMQAHELLKYDTGKPAKR